MANNTTGIYCCTWQHTNDLIPRLSVYVSLGLVTFVVNVSTLVAIILFEKIRENYMVLIASLSFSDALVGLSLLLEPTSAFVDFDACGLDVLAHMAFISYFTTVISQCHTVALSIERWIAVGYALSYHSIMSPFRLKMLVAGCWIVGSLETLVFSVIQYFSRCLWSSKEDFDAMNVLPLVHLVVIFIINAVIYSKLWTAARRQRTQIAQLQQQQDSVTGVSKATVMVMVIVALFGLLWAPMIIARLLQLFSDDTISEHIGMATHYSVVLGSSNSLINCVVYVFFNKNLRNRLDRKLHCHLCLA